MSRAEIIERVRKLPTEEKRQLVEEIWSEFGDEIGWVDSDLTPEQIAELDRRLKEFHKNPSEGIPWEQVREDLRIRYGWE